MATSFKEIVYAKLPGKRIATITLNNPELLNAIGPHMPSEIAEAVALANEDDDVHCIILQGAGRAFCAGYNLKEFAEKAGAREAASGGGGGGGGGGGAAAVRRPRAFDPTMDYRMMRKNTDQFMSLWHSEKPVIAKVHGHAVAGGSDIALCADLIVMADEAKIGYPPARVWGIPTTAHWYHRVGEQRAKHMLLTGSLISGKEAARIGLVLESCPATEIDARVMALAERVAAVPRNQLLMSKMVVNMAVERAGLLESQRLSTFFDGFARHSAEGKWFERIAAEKGFHEAVKARDGGEPIAPGLSVPGYRFNDFAKL